MEESQYNLDPRLFASSTSLTCLWNIALLDLTMQPSDVFTFSNKLSDVVLSVISPSAVNQSVTSPYDVVPSVFSPSNVVPSVFSLPNVVPSVFSPSNVVPSVFSLSNVVPLVIKLSDVLLSMKVFRCSNISDKIFWYGTVNEFNYCDFCSLCSFRWTTCRTWGKGHNPRGNQQWRLV